MGTDSAPEDCFKCGRPLGARAAQGLCSSCLAAGLLEAEPEPLESEESREFGDYELIEEIARGGMGVVYRARQISLNREVALKMILAGHTAGPNTLEMFRREARAAAHLHHPNIVPVFEIGEHDFQDYFTMRLVRGGRTIADWAATQRSDWKAIAAAAAKAARAVAHAHAHGVLHRDLKPSNILWDDESGPQVTDFGLAKLLDEVDLGLTRTQNAMGSPGYMAPEQTGGRARQITTATDVYGLGAVLYELLSGKAPFAGGSTIETLRRAAEEMPAALPNVPADLQTVCFKCMAKTPEDRYSSAAALAEDLERFSRGEPVSAAPLAPAQVFWRWAQRRPQIAALLALTVATFFVGVVGVTWAWRNAVAARKGESIAHEQATSTIVDLYTHSAFNESEPTRAALWFAKAAESASDPLRRNENLGRQMVWRNESVTAVRAFPSEIGALRRLYWNAAQTALIGINEREAAVWDVGDEKRWLPQPGFKMETALWAHHTNWFVFSAAGSVRIMDFPSGREISSMPYRGVRPALALSRNDRLVAVGGDEPFLWDVATGRTNPLPKTAAPASLFDFNANGELLLIFASNRVGVCASEAPANFLFPPVESVAANTTPGFLGTNAFYTSAELTVAAVYDARNGTKLESYTNDVVKGFAPRYGSPDGKYIVNSAPNAIERAKGFSNFPSVGNVIEQATFSEDSALLATACHDDFVRLTQLPSGVTTTVGWHQGGALGVAISPDKKFIATAQGGEALVRVWRLGHVPEPRRIPVAGYTGFRLSKDGSLVLPNGTTQGYFHFDRTRVYSVDTAQPVGPEIVPGGAILDGDLLEDGATVVLVCSDMADRGYRAFEHTAGSGTIQFWNFKTGQRSAESFAFSSEPRAVAVHPSGRWIAVYTAVRELFEIELATRKVTTLKKAEVTEGYESTDTVGNGRCRYSSDGRTLVAWGMRSPPLIWDREAEKLLPAPAVNVTDVDCRNGILATVSMQSRLDFLTLPDVQAARPALQDNDWLFFGRFDPTGDYFVTGGRNKIAHVWDWRRGVQVSPALRHNSEVFSAVFIPDTENVVVASVGAYINFWNRRSGLPARPPVYLGVNIIQIDLTPNARTLVRGSTDDSQLILYSISDLLPKPDLNLGDAILLAQLDAAADIRKGAIEPLSPGEWWKIWKQFRSRQPAFHQRLFP